jgi:SET domain-containing protein
MNFKERFNVNFLEELRFEDARALSWMKKRVKKLQKDPNFNSQNHWAKALFEEDFRKKALPNVSIKEVNSIVGLGVFAQETLRALTYVGHYAGIVRKRKRKEDKTNNYVFRYLETRFRVPYVIDAKENGNICRFLNHSTNPNLLSRSMVIDGIYYIIFFTKRACQKGEQLTYDYGPFYWRSRPNPLNQ